MLWSFGIVCKCIERELKVPGKRRATLHGKSCLLLLGDELV